MVRIFPLCLTILLSNEVVLSLSQACPSNDYVQCASEGGACQISDTVGEGYISYGANGRWNLIPFTNDHTDGTDIRVECDNDHGDIIPGTGKKCCYIEADTGINPAVYHSSMDENYGSWNFDCCKGFTFGMRYGTGSRFIYRMINGADGHCNNNFFNDPAHGHGKVCNYYNEAPPSVPEPYSSKWTLCGNEGGNCNGLDKSAAQWVRYGDNGQYYLRLVISANDGSIPCTNDFFDDPIPGYGKYCWRAKAQFTFTNLVGQWSKLQSCLGCSSNEYKKSVGVTDLTESEITDTWETSLTVTASAGFEYMGASGSIEVSATVANSVTNRMLRSFSKTVSEESTFTCAKDALFQWILGATQNNGISTKTFTVKGEDLACMNNPLEPKCPPGYCTNDACQTCSTSLSALPSIFDPNDPDLPQVPIHVYGWGDYLPNIYTYTYYFNFLIVLGFLIVLCCAVNICVQIWSKRNRERGYSAVKINDSNYK